MVEPSTRDGYRANFDMDEIDIRHTGIGYFRRYCVLRAQQALGAEGAPRRHAVGIMVFANRYTDQSHCFNFIVTYKEKHHASPPQI